MGCLQSTEATPTIGHSLAATNPARSLQPAFVFIDQEESAVGTEQLPPLSVVVPQELSSRPAENPLHLPDSPASSSQQIFPAVAFACSMALDGQQSTSSGSQHGLHDQAFVTAGADAPSFGAISSTAARRHRRSRRTSDEPSVAPSPGRGTATSVKALSPTNADCPSSRGDRSSSRGSAFLFALAERSTHSLLSADSVDTRGAAAASLAVHNSESPRSLSSSTARSSRSSGTLPTAAGPEAGSQNAHSRSTSIPMGQPQQSFISSSTSLIAPSSTSCS